MNLQKRYRNIITRGAKQLPLIPEKPLGQRGAITKSDAHNLWGRFRVHQEASLLFAQNELVPFTNNSPERAPRMGKVKEHFRLSHAYINSQLLDD